MESKYATNEPRGSNLTEKNYLITQAYDSFVSALEKYNLIIEIESSTGSNDLA